MKAGASPLSRQADRAGVVQPGEESRETLEPVPVFKGATRELERDYLQGPIYGTSQT